MREQLSQLSLLQLRDIAKSKGIKNITILRKSALIEQIALVLEQEDAAKAQQSQESNNSLENTCSDESSNSNLVINDDSTNSEHSSNETISDESTLVGNNSSNNDSIENTSEECDIHDSDSDESTDSNNSDINSSEYTSNYRNNSYNKERQISRTRINTYNNHNGGYSNGYNNNYSNSYSNNYNSYNNSYNNNSNYNNNNGYNTNSGTTYGNNTSYSNGYNSNYNSNYNNRSSNRTYNNNLDSSSQDTSNVNNSNARTRYRSTQRTENRTENLNPAEYAELDSGENAHGILEILTEGYGFIRSENFLPGDNDVYVSPAQIRRFNMKTGDFITGSKRIRTQDEKFQALLYINQINGRPPHEAETRTPFEDLTPVFPNDRLRLETFNGPQSMRIVDLISPIGKGQRGMIVSPPKAGKTTLLKQVANAITKNHPDMHLIILLIDERPEEVTDIKESIEGDNLEVIYSTFDEQPEHHKRVAEMVLERAKRLVEHKRDVMILLDSITRLARAYNLLVTPSGRTLSGGLDPASLYIPKKFFGAARNMREGGSLTILATALVDTGSRMDDVIFEEFKGTGNMELMLDRKLSERRIFPAIELLKSGTRRDDLLLNPAEQEATSIMRKATTGLKPEEAAERIMELFAHTKTNREFVDIIRKQKFI